MKIKAVVEIEVDIDVETFEQVNDCLYDLLYDGLCRDNESCEFWINNVEEMK